jgi:hypothetical protein
MLRRFAAVLLRLTGMFSLLALAAFVLWMTYLFLWFSGLVQPSHAGS